MTYIPTGIVGPQGINAYSTSYGFTQPQAGTAVALQVPSGNWLQVGQYVFIASGGFYTVASGSVPTFSFNNLGYSGNIPVGSAVATGFVSPAGVAGATGPQGATGATGTALGNVTVATTVWVGPTGSDVKSFLVSAITTLAVPTALIFSYPITPNSITDVNATMLGMNGVGASGMFKQDFNGTFGVTGITGAIQTIGTVVTTNQRFPLGASGWNATVQAATGPSLSFYVSTPTGSVQSGVVTGTVKWVGSIQIMEGIYP